MRLMDMIRQWVESHAPEVPWSDTLWRSKSPLVRETALDRTYSLLEMHEREMREAIARLEADVKVLRQQAEQKTVVQVTQNNVTQTDDAG